LRRHSRRISMGLRVRRAMRQREAGRRFHRRPRRSRVRRLPDRGVAGGSFDEHVSVEGTAGCRSQRRSRPRSIVQRESRGLLVGLPIGAQGYLVPVRVRFTEEYVPMRDLGRRGDLHASRRRLMRGVHVRVNGRMRRGLRSEVHGLRFVMHENFRVNVALTGAP
jgi:hypothetical protein